MKGKRSCLQLQARATVSISGSSLMSSDCRKPAPAAPHLPVHQHSLPGPGCPPRCSPCKRDWRTDSSSDLFYFYFLPFDVFQPHLLPGVVFCVETECTTWWWRKGQKKWVWVKGIPETRCCWELFSSSSGLGCGSCCLWASGLHHSVLDVAL